ncbi:MAG: hypothetical protein JRJ85_11530 [Deltaproteobacteria bacterium]|nr:hypothetical protein [Deltaproteobacteria bacterium]
MSQNYQKIIDQFNRDEQSWRRLQRLKLKRRVRFPRLGTWRHALLDLLDELRERQRPVDCIGSKWK